MPCIITKSCFDRFTSVEANKLFTIQVGLEKLVVTATDGDIQRIVGALTNNDRASDAKFFLYEDLNDAKRHVESMLENVTDET